MPTCLNSGSIMSITSSFGPFSPSCVIPASLYNRDLSDSVLCFSSPSIAFLSCRSFLAVWVTWRCDSLPGPSGRFWRRSFSCCAAIEVGSRPTWSPRGDCPSSMFSSPPPPSSPLLSMVRTTSPGSSTSAKRWRCG